MVPRRKNWKSKIGSLACLLLCATLGGDGLLGQSPGNSSEAVSITGQVVDAISGQPLRQVTVVLTVVAMAVPPENRQLPLRISTTTDAAGNFIYRNLPAGRYRLQGEKSGYVPAVYSTHPGQIQTLLHGEPGQQLTGVVFKLFPQGVLSGQVLDEYGEPVAGAPVVLLRQMDYFKRITERAGGGGTNAIGEFLIGELRPGNYLVLAEPASPRMSRAAVLKQRPEEQGTYLPTYYPGSLQPKAAAAIQVNAGQHVRGIDVWLQKGRLYEIRGRIEGLGFEIIGGLRVNLVSEEAGGRTSSRRPFREMETDRAGGFVISGVMTGEYQLIVSRLLNNGLELMAIVPVSVSNRDVKDLLIQGVPKGPVTIAGRISVEGSSTPLAGTGVGLRRLGPDVPFLPVSDAEVRDDGKFAIENVFAGKYQVEVFYPEGDTWYVKRIAAGTTDVLRDGLDMTQSPAMPPLQVVISLEGGMIEGVAMDGDTPRAGAYVTLFPEALKDGDQLLRRGANTDDSGQFVIQNVAPGSYRLFAWEQRFPFYELEEQDLRPFESSAVNVRVEENSLNRVAVPIIPLP